MESNFDNLKFKWYKALATENCRELKNLLREDERLLHEGWRDDKQTQTWVQENFQRGWKGRTPLHAAARRGDIQLMEHILGLICSCNGPTPKATSKGDEACSDSSNCNLLKEVDGDRTLGLIRCSGTPNATDGDDEASPSSANCHLLKVVDGDYDLDALAMAVVNGNKAIVTSLKNASLRCKSNPYKIRPTSQSREREKSPDQNYAPGLILDENGAIMVAAHPDWANIRALSEETEKVLNNVAESDRQMITALYADDSDFNFLDISVYLFHFTFSTWKTSIELKGAIERIRKDIFSAVIMTAQTPEENLVLKCLLFDLKDGQGRTALHVAVDSSHAMVVIFLDLIAGVSGDQNENDLQICSDSCSALKLISQSTRKDHLDYLNTIDSAGRTPLYRAAAKNNVFVVQRLLMDKRTDVNARIAYPADKWGVDLDLDKLSTRSGFQSDCAYIPKTKLWTRGFNNKTNALGGPGPFIKPLLEASSTALHVAIIHKYDLIVDLLLEHDASIANNHSKSCPRGDRDLSCKRLFTWPVTPGSGPNYQIERSVSPMQLSVLVGNIPVVQRLLEYQQSEQTRKGWKSQLVLNKSPEENKLPSFQLAAAMGKPDTIKAFIDTGKHSPLIQDDYGNTALHHALNGKYVQVHPHLIDFVGCHHVFMWRWENDEWMSPWLADSQDEETASMNKTQGDRTQHSDRYGQRRGAINLLLQAGINIWEKNHKGRTARPQPDSPEDFVTWWYDQVAAETQRVQAQLNAAANAISVTAALVATASYVGPFAPPLGYGGVDLLQAGILAVRIFVVCNNISFYFALASIMFALLPSVPMPQESTFKALRKTRIQVAIALLFLLPSIVCVLVAFASCYITILPEHGLAHHSLTLTSTVVGGIFCLIVIIRFLLRLGNVLLTLPTGPTHEIDLIEEFFTGGEALSMKENLKRCFKARENSRRFKSPRLG